MFTNRQSIAAAVAVAAVCAAGAAGAQPEAQAFTDTARVVSSTPIYDRVAEPRQQCSTEYQPPQQVESGSAPLGAIAGGVVGGLIGHQFGGGRGNTAATIGGAAVGAAVGSQYDRGGTTYTEPGREVQRCETVADTRDAIRGYTVTYLYNGRQFMAEMPYDPGPRLNIDVSVAPQSR